MHEINKEHFAALLAERRKAMNLTQKQLAEKLYVSDKAVSKWETGVSIPDTALLIPLAKMLGVTVTELLTGEKDPGSGDTENAVKTAIAYSRETRKPEILSKPLRLGLVVLLSGLMLLELVLLERHGLLQNGAAAISCMTAAFALYFFVLARDTLPLYYDENQVAFLQDGFFRMNLPGVRFTNGNWPVILRVGRIWSAVMMLLYPLLSMGLGQITEGLESANWLPILVYILSLFLPMWFAARRCQ